MQKTDILNPTEKPHVVIKPVVGRYELRKMLGEGGMGVVYEAFDTRTGGLVAVKMMRDISDPRTVEMFKKESAVLARLSHPNIVDIRDVDEIEEGGKRRPCFVMPLLPGVTLAKLIKESSPRLTVGCVVGIIGYVCSGLNAAHKESLFHRDLKPSNIFVMEDDTAKIIDFGLVHSADAQSVTGYKGTWQYMAPEQTEGKEATARSDIFSLGVVAYEALTGRKPFARATVQETVEAIRRYSPLPLSGINPKASQLLGKVIHKAMAKQPVHRYASAREFAESLQKAYRNEQIPDLDAAAIQPRIERARKAFAKGDWEFAEDVLSALETEGNVDPEITLLRAQIDEGKKQRTVRQLFEAARTRLEQDEIPLALDKLREILDLDPGNPDALAMRNRVEVQRNEQQVSRWMGLAREHMERHDFQEARQALKEVLNIRYNDSNALQMLSDLDEQEKEAAAARIDKEQLYGSALRAYQNGEISTALSKLEKILEVTHRTPGAGVPERDAVYQTFYNQVRSERDGIDRAYEEGQRSLSEKNFAKALEICDQMLAAHPQGAQFQALKLKVEQAERQELSAYIAEIGRCVDSEPDLDRRVSILEEACERYSNEAQFQQSLRLVREHRDLVHSIQVKARQYEEQSQFAEAIGQWKILRNIHPQYPGVEFELEQLERLRDQQALAETKARRIEQISRALDAEGFRKAHELAQNALTEFPDDQEISALEKVARQGSERTREAERLFEEAKTARAGGYLKQATGLLQSALKLNPGSALLRNDLVSVLVERAHGVLDQDWQKADELAQSAAALDQAHPAVRRIQSLVAETRHKTQVDQCVSQVLAFEQAGKIAHALRTVEEGLVLHAGESRLLQYQSRLQRLLQKGPENISLEPEPTIEGGQGAPSIEFIENSGGTLFGGDSLAQTREDYLPEGSAPAPVLEPGEPKRPAVPNQHAVAQAKAKAIWNSTRKTVLNLQGRTAALLVQTKPWLQTVAVKVRNSKKNTWLWSAPLFLLLALIGIVLLVHSRRGRSSSTTPPVSSGVDTIVPVTIFPDDATVTVNGSVKKDRTLLLPAYKDYSVTVSRLGFRSESRDRLKPIAGAGWAFHLEPEPLKISLYTAADSGKVLLDGREIGNLDHGQLLDYEMAADGHNHTLAARDENGELFAFDFQAEAGRRPRIAPLTTKELIVANSLGSGVTVFSGTLPETITLEGQESREISRDGTDLQLPGSLTTPQLLLVGNSKKHREVMITAGNQPSLVVSLRGNPNYGAIFVKTSSEGPRLFVDGTEVKTRKPGSWYLSAKPGAHKLRIAAPGLQDAEFEVQVEKGKQITRIVELDPAGASLFIADGTPGARVLIDGKPDGTIQPAGSYALDKMTPGSHEIEIEKENFEPLIVRELFSAGQKIKIPGALKEFGFLSFDVSPSDAAVKYRRVDQSEWQPGSTSDSAHVKAGRYEVMASANGFDGARQDFYVSSGGTQVFKITLKPHTAANVKPTPTQAAPLSFFAVPDQLQQIGDWLTGKTNSFLSLKPSITKFEVLFLKPGKMPPHRHKPRHLQWIISLYPDAQIAYELDGEQIVRKLRTNGEEGKATVKGDASDGDSAFAVVVTLQSHQVQIRNKQGTLLDEVKDQQHDWSKAIAAIKGDAFFLVRTAP